VIYSFILYFSYYNYASSTEVLCRYSSLANRYNRVLCASLSTLLSATTTVRGKPLRTLTNPSVDADAILSVTLHRDIVRPCG
jgi:hypothetical protein